MADYHGHWEAKKVDDKIYTNFVKHQFSEKYKNLGFDSINMYSPNQLSSFMKKKSSKPTIAYYQKQMDNRGEPRGTGKYKNYGIKGTFGISK